MLKLNLFEIASELKQQINFNTRSTAINRGFLAGKNRCNIPEKCLLFCSDRRPVVLYEYQTVMGTKCRVLQ
jgi:hypothetical protein